MTRQLRMIGIGIVILIASLPLPPSLAADAPPTSPPPNIQPAWKTAKTQDIGNLTVSVSEPIRIARSKDRLWFPTITRMADDKLMALMSAEADVVGVKPGKRVAWSTDGGLSWSEPVSQPLLRGGGAVRLPGGLYLVLPFTLNVHKDGSIGSPYPIIDPMKQEVGAGEGELTVTGWPKPMPDHTGEGALAGFSINRQTISAPGGRDFGTLYGRFKGDKRLTLMCTESQDDLHWTIRGIIADESCKLPGREGPNEAALCRLKDGRLMSIFRLDSSAMYGQAFSSDDGKTWTEPVGMNDVFSVSPYLLVNPDGVVLLSGGRPGIYLWVNADGTGKDWQKVDLQAIHNAAKPTEVISGPHTTAYTHMQWIDPTHLLCIYDRVPFGWGTIPKDSREMNSVWVMRIGVERPPEQKSEIRNSKSETNSK